MLRIIDPEKIKITSIKYKGEVIHFKYEDEHYFINNGGMEMTSVVSLYKGRTKYKCECLKSNFGFISFLIEYKNNKRVLKHIDKYNFAKRLKEADLIEFEEVSNE